MTPQEMLRVLRQRASDRLCAVPSRPGAPAFLKLVSHCDANGLWVTCKVDGWKVKLVGFRNASGEAVAWLLVAEQESGSELDFGDIASYLGVTGAPVWSRDASFGCLWAPPKTKG